ncbi:unnamed protein product [Enterobius vermicularis]|uniref:GPI transamidase component PIG-T n=1 Tax=Enterobius vermicularis TaxID=51028 RepID=A0A3P6IIR7_ENTVE|nr:unnamed protein product [Enterobius vermicularis]
MHSGPDYILFPRIVAEISNNYDVEVFHFSLTQGFWRNSEWGIPPQPASPSGAQLFCSFRGIGSEFVHKVADKWNHFVNSLNGIFCTSLLEMVPLLTATPRHFPFAKNGSEDEFTLHHRYGALASETVCTENLTPWKKLLPCKETGLSEILSPEKLYSSNYHSLSIHFTRGCQDISKSCRNRTRLELGLDMVTDIDLRSHSLVNSCFRFTNRFIMFLHQSVISTGKLIVAIVNISPTEKKKYNSRQYYIYNIHEIPTHMFPFNLHSQYRRKLDLSQQKPSSLFSVHSFLGIADQHAGKIITSIENLQSLPQSATYFHVIPWFIQIYFHTVKFFCVSLSGRKGSESTVPKLLNFVPAKSRMKPFLLEYQLFLPAGAVCELSFEFDKAFLRVTDYPPDANRGMYVPAAMISFKAEEEIWQKNRSLCGIGGSRLVSVFSEVLLVSLPVPDFSMPFNVICFVSTAIAMLFGPIHSLTTKMLAAKLIPVDEADKDLVSKPLFTALILKLWNLVKVCIARLRDFKNRKKVA